MMELTTYTMKQPNWRQKLSARMRLPLEEQIQQMAADPGAAAILAKKNLSAKEYVVGLLALRAAFFSAKGMNTGLGSLALPANVALVKGNPALAQRFEKGEMGGR